MGVVVVVVVSVVLRLNSLPLHLLVGWLSMLPCRYGLMHGLGVYPFLRLRRPIHRILMSRSVLIVVIL